MTDVSIPNFGELLGPYLGSVPDAARPYFLSQLERAAAARYRGWAQALPEHAEGILACADREDLIADRVEALYSPSDEHRRLVDSLVPEACAAYLAVFDGLSSLEQMTIQEDAERQGAGAWQRLKNEHPEHAVELDELSATETVSADYLKTLLDLIGGR